MTTESRPQENVAFPPLELANRVGSLEDFDDPFARYDEIGRLAKRSILSVLPADWSFEGKRVLDFGCGAGRMLRHFISEARSSDFSGCDIDEESVAWVQSHLCPPFRAFVNGEEPPLPLESGSLDFIYASSVFTHLAETWDLWLLELHRVLADGGILIATFIGEGAAHWITDEPYEEDQVGMSVLKAGQSWDLGGPMILHSPWWITAHWGRAFEIVELRRHGFATEPPEGQGIAVMRKKTVDLTEAELQRPDPDEPREALAALHNAKQLLKEVRALRESESQLAASWRVERATREELERQASELRASLDRIERSRSWRVTRPLRSMAERARMNAGRRVQ